MHGCVRQFGAGQKGRSAHGPSAQRGSRKHRDSGAKTARDQADTPVFIPAKKRCAEAHQMGQISTAGALYPLPLTLLINTFLAEVEPKRSASSSSFNALSILP